MAQGGVYVIKNIANGHRYIGSAVCLTQRWNGHRHLLRKGAHHNPHLQSAWNLYGEDSFRFELLEPCEPEECIIAEQSWLDAFPPEYNMAPIAESSLGRPCREETRAKISAANRGKPKSPEHKAKMLAVHLGAKRTPEARANMSAAQLGHVASNKGKKHAPESIAKMSIAHKGKKRSAESRAKQSIANTGREVSAETRAKIAAAKRGWEPSAEWRAKNSATHKGQTAWNKGATAPQREWYRAVLALRKSNRDGANPPLKET